MHTLKYLETLVHAVTLVLTFGWDYICNFATMVHSFYKKKVSQSLISFTEDATYRNVVASLKRLTEISYELVNLSRSIDGPQKNALHGRSKNQINAMIDSLLEERVTLISSVLKSGYNPKIKYQGLDGNIASMTLAEYAAEFLPEALPTATPTPSSSDISDTRKTRFDENKKSLRLTLVKGDNSK